MAGCASRRGGVANVYADYVEPLTLKYMRYDKKDALCPFHVEMCVRSEKEHGPRVILTESGPSESCFNDEVPNLRVDRLFLFLRIGNVVTIRVELSCYSCWKRPKSTCLFQKIPASIDIQKRKYRYSTCESEVQVTRTSQARFKGAAKV